MNILSYYYYYTTTTTQPTYLPTPQGSSEYREYDNRVENGASCTLLMGELGHSDVLICENPARMVSVNFL